MRKFNGIIDRYIIRELDSALFRQCGIFYLRISDDPAAGHHQTSVVNYQVGLWDVTRMLFYSMPFSLNS